MHHKKKQDGFTLVELIISMLISTFVIAIAMTSFAVNIKYINMETGLSQKISSIESIITPLKRNLKNSVVDFWVDPRTSAIDTPTTDIAFVSMGPTSYVTYHYFLQNNTLYYTIDGGVKHMLLTNVTNIRLLADDISSRAIFNDAPLPNPNATVIDGNGFNRTIRSYTLMLEVSYPSLVTHKGFDFMNNPTRDGTLRYHRYVQFYAPAAYL